MLRNFNASTGTDRDSMRCVLVPMAQGSGDRMALDFLTLRRVEVLELLALGSNALSDIAGHGIPILAMLRRRLIMFLLMVDGGFCKTAVCFAVLNSGILTTVCLRLL